MRVDAEQPDDLLVERRDERRLACLLQRREVLADPFSSTSWPSTSISSTSRGASPGLASRILGFGSGLGFGGWRRRGLRRFGAGSRSFAASRVGLCRLALPRQHRDVERGAPVLRAEVAQDNPRHPRAWPIGPLASIPNTGFARRVGQPDLAEAALARRADARADQLQPAVAGGFGERVELLVAHSLSSTCRTRPTRPPTSVPLIRIY